MKSRCMLQYGFQITLVVTVKILFIAPNRLGDAILASGLIEQCRRRYPGAQFTIACGPVAAPLFQALPGLVEILVLRKSSGWRRWHHWADLLAVGWGQYWGLVVDMRGSASALVLPTRRRRIWRGGKPDQHRVMALSGFLDPSDATPPAPHVWLSAAHHAQAAAIIGDDPRPILALAPTANWIGKIWPIERFVAVAKALTAHDGPLAAGRILVAGGPAERAAALPLIKAFDSDDVIDLVDRTDLLTLAACIGKAELFIGNDSGLMHLSAAVGTTTLGLFGPSRDDHYRPWGNDNMAVRSAQTYAALMPGGHPQAHDICLMTGLSVATVTTAARAQLSAVSG